MPMKARSARSMRNRSKPTACTAPTASRTPRSRSTSSSSPTRSSANGQSGKPIDSQQRLSGHPDWTVPHVRVAARTFRQQAAHSLLAAAEDSAKRRPLAPRNQAVFSASFRSASGGKPVSPDGSNGAGEGADMRSLKGILLLVDRTMALFVGLAVGAVVTLSFGGPGGEAAIGAAQASIPAVPEPPRAQVRP